MNGTTSPPASRCKRLVESFNGSFRNKCLNGNPVLITRSNPRRHHRMEEGHNRNRPRSSLDNITPSEFAMKMAIEK
ncbi:MAG: integrase core domain-containing protein [Shinella sp.]|nr:integrase core domain-containing protein [Shinella sp.]